MPKSTRPRQRDLERTRSALLSAARQEVKKRGIGVSLDVIARASGVSKGGLLHHFPTKDELLFALIKDVYEEFEAEVTRRAAEEPAGPGRLARAYVRATFHELRAPDLLLEHSTLLSFLSMIPSISEFAREELTHWTDTLSSDGISADVVRLVMLAADGASAGMLSMQTPSPSDLDDLEHQLVALIKRHETVAELIHGHNPLPSP